MNDECKEADAYVRDHLLIEWLCEYFKITHVDIERYYDDWIEWLNRHDRYYDDRVEWQRRHNEQS